jgi:signal-transduction protein with cAMP-binding, CBS, and nucleotidyltransferase domain
VIPFRFTPNFFRVKDRLCAHTLHKGACTSNAQGFRLCGSPGFSPMKICTFACLAIQSNIENINPIQPGGQAMNTVRNILEVKGGDLWSIMPGATVYDALRMMADKDIGALLVMDGDKLAGILSERDYARKVILHNKSSRETLVREIMTEKVFTVHPAQTVQECMELMTQKHIRHLPVVDDEGKVYGVISIGDVVKDIMYQQRKKIRDYEDRAIKQS